MHQTHDHDIKWRTVVAPWVDSEIAGLMRPVLFSLQREFGDPVLLASTKAARKVVSLHNCHYRDPEDPESGFRAAFRPILSRPLAVDEMVCLTQQQRLELTREVPGAVLPQHPLSRPAAASGDG